MEAIAELDLAYLPLETREFAADPDTYLADARAKHPCSVTCGALRELARRASGPKITQEAARCSSLRPRSLLAWSRRPMRSSCRRLSIDVLSCPGRMIYHLALIPRDYAFISLGGSPQRKLPIASARQRSYGRGSKRISKITAATSSEAVVVCPKAYHLAAIAGRAPQV